MTSHFDNASVLWGHVVIDELVRGGVRHVFVTPGSRSTPLVLAAAAHPDVVDHSVIDERSAAFAALGVGLATGVPAALVCTSGTAAANYLPAVAEADLGGVPLVVVTADRPANLSDAGASQAMSQVGLFGDKVRWSHDLGLPAADSELLAHARSRACRAVFEAVDGCGPVHLNVRFRKPLEYSAVGAEHRDVVPAVVRESEAARGRGEGRPWTTYSSPAAQHVVPEDLAALMRESARPVVVVGARERMWSDLAKAVESFADALGAPVLAETMSGLRTPGRSARVVAGDLVCSDAEFVESHRPDLVVQVGRWPINWPVQRWLTGADCPRVVVAERPADPEHRADFVVGGESDSALRSLAAAVDGGVRETSGVRSRAEAWAREWCDRSRALACAFGVRVREEANLDGHVARAVAEWGEPVFVSSSMPLRDVETFVESTESPVLANRGLNGIDGVISTAAGVSVALGERVQVVIGDVAFVHDVSGLVTARRVGAELQVNVVDNGGGRIFDHLPVSGDSGGVFARHFTTDPGLDLVELARGFGVRSVRVAVEEAYDCRGESDVIVFTNRGGDPKRTKELVQEAVLGVRDEAASGGVASGGVASGGVASGGVASGPPEIVALHGFTGDATTWRAVLDRLGPSAVALDLPGHGGRPAEPRPTLDRMVDDVLSQLDDLGVERAHLVGYSMGGRVAMALATQAPERVRSLVTIGAYPGLEDQRERAARRDHDWALADRLERDGLEAFLDFWLGLPIFASLGELGDTWLERSREQRRRGSARAYAQTLRWSGTGTQQPMWSALTVLDRPHLAMAGGLDEKYAAIVKQLEARTGAQGLIIESSGHAVHYERPDEVASAIETFVANVNDATKEAS
jgi:2-succinyl-5-enolpyruvyl-6-hydroxy-3-cyclohexene-1-carboxylate synthase